MARYSDGSGLHDTAIVVTDAHLDSADIEVDLVLAGKGISPADVTLPQPALTLLANAYAAMKAAREGAIHEGSPLIAKAASYEREAARIAGGITLASLGLTVESSVSGFGLGSVLIGRG